MATSHNRIRCRAGERHGRRRVHALSILRKIILRMKSWENFVF